MKITHVFAREIFDSRGIPTIECEIILDNDSVFISSVPSGISKSSYEAQEKRDEDKRLRGLGVLKAVNIIDTVIAPQLIGRKPNFIEIDIDLLELDGTDNKSCLGANTVLAVSIAVCKAQAYSENLSIYELIAQICKRDIVALPLPMFNIFGGGLHAQNNFPIQELLLIPNTLKSFHEAMEVGVTIFYAVKSCLSARKMVTAVGYEGEFISQFKTIEEPFDILMEAICKSGYENDVMIAIDCAASSFYNKSTNLYEWNNTQVDAHYLIEYYQQLMNLYPLYSIEDGLDENDWNNWKVMQQELGKQVKLIGDDIFATNPQRIWSGIENNVATAALIKPNQIGTLTETLQSILLCKDNGWDIILSHRSGETNDSFIADLAVAVSATHIKAGGCSRGERIAKYNRLLQIEDELNNNY